MKNLTLGTAGTLFLILIACQDPNPLVDEGRDILEAYGEMVSDTLYAVSDTFIINGKVSTASSSRLLLGAHAGYETRILLRFSNLPPDTVILDSVRLMISSFADFGPDLSHIDGTVYRVKESWEESVNADELWDYKANIDYAPETSANFSFAEL